MKKIDFTKPSVTKKCTKCGVEKVLAEFNFKNKSKEKRKPECRKCQNIYQTKYRESNRQAIQEKGREHYKKKKASASKSSLPVTQSKGRGDSVFDQVTKRRVARTQGYACPISKEPLIDFRKCVLDMKLATVNSESVKAIRGVLSLEAARALKLFKEDTAAIKMAYYLIAEARGIACLKSQSREPLTEGNTTTEILDYLADEQNYFCAVSGEVEPLFAAYDSESGILIGLVAKSVRDALEVLDYEDGALPRMIEYIESF